MRSLVASIFDIMVDINVSMAGSTCWIAFAVDALGTSVYYVITSVVYHGRSVSGLCMLASGIVFASAKGVYSVRNCSIIWETVALAL